MTSNCLTIDVGTTNTKVTLWCNGIPEIKQFVTPKKTIATQTNFELGYLWDEIVKTISSFDPISLKKVTQIAVASFGESGILLDEKNNPIGQCISWFDDRAQIIVDQITEEKKSRIYQLTGLPVNAHYSALKIAWLLKYDKTITMPLAKYKWLCVPDYLVYRFTGNLATEYTIASRTLCLDIKTGKWSKEVQRLLGISNISFPEIYSAGCNLGYVQGKLGKLFAQECQVIIAGHDHMCGAAGVGLGEAELLDSTGTTEAMMTIVKHFDISSRAQKNALANGIYVDGRHYTRFTAMPAAGSTIAWLMNLCRINENKLVELMNEAQKGYDDYSLFKSRVLVMPHFNGSGSPNKMSSSKGIIYGLTSQTTLVELIFGLFLGLTCEFKIAYTALFDSERYHLIKVIGPAAKDPLWLELKADILQANVISIDTEQAVSEGAYVIATKHHLKGKTHRYEPTTDNQKQQYLNRMFKIYQMLYQDKLKHDL
ncbi:MAG: sugar kinase [Lactobacillus sp.]|nr:sugar kinase [Lactobacillus sp.]